MTVLVTRGAAYDRVSGNLAVVVDATVSLTVNAADVAGLREALDNAANADTPDRRTDAFEGVLDEAVERLVSAVLNRALNRVRVLDAERTWKHASVKPDTTGQA